MNIKKYEVADSSILDHILDNITSAVFLVNDDAEILAFNKTFARLFQIGDQEELTEVLFGNIIRCQATKQIQACGSLPQCKICDIRNAIHATIRNKENLNDLVFPQEIWDQGVSSIKYFKISTRPINDGDSTLALVILDDITELESKKAMLEEQNRKLLEMNELKNRFVGIAAHDLRNPIAAIQGCSTIMSRTLDSSTREEINQLLEIISEKSQFSLNLIGDLLDITKIESGESETAMEENDLAELLLSNAKIYKILADQKNLDVVVELKGKLPRFKFHKGKIEQALNNLVDNAIKYSNEGTLIKIEAYQDNGLIVTRIIDQGQGIAEHELTEIFKPFYRANIDPNNKHKSTGLGLAIVKKIVENHRGEVVVESEPGKGSVFTMLLPIS
jgi:signal transduction histidine kinase